MVCFDINLSDNLTLREVENVILDYVFAARQSAP
jgi:hypothetical protein